MSTPVPEMSASTRHQATLTVWTTVEGVSRPRSGASVALFEGEVVVVAARRGRVVGQLLIAPAQPHAVFVDGLGVGPGMHALRHGQRVEFGGTTAWVAGDPAPIERTYDPAIDGAEQRCLRTKVRLVAGEPITVCPGTDARPCGGLFRRAAWTAGLVCHVCGFDPAARRWRPPVSAASDALRRLLALGGDDAQR